MTAVLDGLALLVAAAGVLVVVTSLAWPARWWLGASIGLELWTAAGLLRLAGEPTWSRVMVASAVVAVRKLVLAARPSPPGRRCHAERFRS